MDKNTLIKWALIAGAAYLLYRWAVAQGYIGGAAAQELPAGTGAGAGAGAGADAGAGNNSTGASSAGSPTSVDIAASLLATPGFSYWGINGEGGTTQNGHHWNYYWRRSSLFNGRDASPGELGVADDFQMTLDEYSSRVYNLLFAASSGVSGLLLLPASPAFASAWKM